MAIKIIRSNRAAEKQEKDHPVSPFQLFEDFFDDWTFRSLEGRCIETWIPAADVLEQEGNLLFMIELPGIQEKALEIRVDGLVLTIRGEKKLPESEGYTYHQMESSFGAFSRCFNLANSLDLDSIKATYKNGILTLTIPKNTES